MVIKNIINDTVKFKINKSKFITLKKNEEYVFDCDSTDLSIELLNISLSSRKKIIVTLLVFPLLFVLYVLSSMFSNEPMCYSCFYEINDIHKNDYIYIENSTNKDIVLNYNNHFLNTIGYSKGKSFLLSALLSSYTLLIYSLLAFIIYNLCK